MPGTVSYQNFQQPSSTHIEAVLTREVPKHQTARRDNVQLTLDYIGATLSLLDRAVGCETEFSATYDLLEETDRGHVGKTGPEMGDEYEDPKHGDDKSWRTPLGWSLEPLAVHFVTCC